MKQIKVYLLKHFADKKAMKSLPANKGGDFFYIGGKNKDWKLGNSPLANPFGISKDCSQKLSTESYKSWLFDKIKKVDKKVVPTLLKITTSKKPIIVCNNKRNAQVVLSACRWLEKLFSA